MNKYVVIPAAVMLALSLSGKAADQSESKPTSEPAASSADAGMRAYIDPNTGRLSPTPVTKEQQELSQRSLQGSSRPAPMVERVLADGTVMIELNGNFEMAQQAVIGADGKLRSVCTDAAHADQASHEHEAARAPARSDEY